MIKLLVIILTLKNTGDARVCSTAMAVNALIGWWTYERNGRIYWMNDVNPLVKEIVMNSVNWLTQNAANQPQQLQNAFFSGSVKGPEVCIQQHTKIQYIIFNASRVDYYNMRLLT